jgi:uncharacterized protein (DUF885 family)
MRDVDTQPMPPAYAPDLTSLVGRPASALVRVLERFSADRAALSRRYPIAFSGATIREYRRFYDEWLSQLEGIAFDELDRDGRVDFLLLKRRIARGLLRLKREEKLAEETADLVPFAEAIVELREAELAIEPVDGERAAAALAGIETRARELHDRMKAEVERRSSGEGDAADLPPVVRAHRAARRSKELLKVLEEWHGQLHGYDPLFSWWAQKPYEKASEALKQYAEFLTKEIVGQKEGDDPPVVGDPIGREAVVEALEQEMIAYSPEELVAVAEREYSWCERQIGRASSELGCGSDWKRALSLVKERHAPPGGQPALVRELAEEAVRFLEERDLVTIPDLARQVWRQRMIEPEKQKVNPFFYGGEVIGTSFPHSDMPHDEKLSSMRGNNIHFARATVHHELIPGHHLQLFVSRRKNAHRREYGTPFYSEGWPLYWEILLWELGFARSAEDRVGMLFWRMYRCARIVFSLKFHLGAMSERECIDFLIERVGHEKHNAEAEVRRSVEGDYEPLYQAAYMLGGLQIRALRRELVESGSMTDREFHDAVLEANSMPVELLRAALTDRPIREGSRAEWRFADD